MRLPVFLLPLLAACAAQRPPESPVELRIEDQPGRRVVSVELERRNGAWEVSGVLHGSRLDTADRRTVILELLDASGQATSTREVVASAHTTRTGRPGLDRARFRASIPDPGLAVAAVRVQVQGG